MRSLPSYSLLNFAARSVFIRRLKLQTRPVEMPYAVNEPVALYLHIPFCESLCTYCSFHRQLMDEPLARQYFKALRKQIKSVHDTGWRVGQVYIGGGTPTVLIDELAQTIELTHRLFNTPVTSVETNPNHLTNDKLQPLEDLGVRRLSVGVQSFDNDLLTRMNRFKAYGSAESVLEKLHNVNDRFETVNVDMIFNLPGQSVASLKYDIQALKSLEAKQISWYPLMPNQSALQSLTDSLGPYQRKTEWQGFKTITQGLADQYNAASAWCFNLNSQPCTDEYIVNYQHYLGLGSGAFSAIGHSMFASSFSIEKTIRKINQGLSSLAGSQHFSNLEWMQYQLMLQLFSLKVSAHYSDHRALQKLWKGELRSLLAVKAIVKQGDLYSVTLRGQYLALVLMREFFVAVNRLREQMNKLNDYEKRISLKQVS